MKVKLNILTDFLSRGSGPVRAGLIFAEKEATTKVQQFNEPVIGMSSDGTLHGKRTDANGYTFLEITLFGSPNVHSVKGCSLTFQGARGKISCKSDSKDIKSIYSDTLRKGITTFEIYLDDVLLESLRNRVTSVEISFPRRIFGKQQFMFSIQPSQFSKLLVK